MFSTVYFLLFSSYSLDTNSFFLSYLFISDQRYRSKSRARFIWFPLSGQIHYTPNSASEYPIDMKIRHEIKINEENIIKSKSDAIMRQNGVDLPNLSDSEP